MKKLLAALIVSAFCLGSVTSVWAQDADFDLPKVWKKSCRKCHDADGSGGTPAGKKLHVKDYTKAEDQASFTDEEAIKAIKDGIVGEDGKNKMDAYPEFTDEQIAALVQMVRAFAVPTEG